jgi:GTPase Era involved in 16S rRNA processing
LLAVVGEFSSGKSYLINTLLGKPGLLATDINPSTATITELEYGEQSEAHAYHDDGRVERVPLDALAKFVAAEAQAPSRVIITADSPFLRRGFTLADTPGLASINPEHRRATLQFLPRADAVLYLIDTQQPFTEGDASFLGIVRQHLDTIFLVQTKIDLWQQTTDGGKPAWESARDRIAQLAAIHAPGAYVYALSAREYAKGVEEHDAALMEHSRFPKFLAALDASLVRNTGRARVRRACEEISRGCAGVLARITRDREMLALGAGVLQERRAQAEPRIGAMQQFVDGAKTTTAASSQRLVQALKERGETLAQDAQRALGHAFDTADVARLRDRARLHIIVDRTLGEAAEVFAQEVSSAIFSEYERAQQFAEEQIPLRFSFSRAAAHAFGASGGSNAWTEEPQQTLCATIVLEALGGPAISLVQQIATRFAASPPGAYMKRELTADLRETIWPAFEDDMRVYTAGIAAKLAAIATAYTAALNHALEQARDAALGSIDRALAAQAAGENPAALAAALEQRASSIQAAVRDISQRVDAFLAHGEEIAPADAGPETVRRAHVDAEFDREAYRRGLRPQRWRVAVLGALRRGKSSLINAFAGRRVLADEVAGAIAFPVHVRYGAQEGAFALQPDGSWREVEMESALDEAARNPVLILTPWSLPRELVLVHAPAFDAGDATLEDVCMVAAREASEVLCLFSRQLSDREISLYERVADLGKPMMFVHTLADNESQSERRHVVDLAQQYLRERTIPAQRVFTVSTLEFAQAKREGRAPAGWNELQALISTIEAHAEEHMARLQRLERAAAQPASTHEGGQAPAEQKSRGLFARFFSR